MTGNQLFNMKIIFKYIMLFFTKFGLFFYIRLRDLFYNNLANNPRVFILIITMYLHFWKKVILFYKIKIFKQNNMIFFTEDVWPI